MEMQLVIKSEGMIDFFYNKFNTDSRKAERTCIAYGTKKLNINLF